MVGDGAGLALATVPRRLVAVIYARQDDGRVLVDRELLAAATGRPTGTIRRQCTARPDGLYDLDQARRVLAVADALPAGPAVALTATEAQRWLGVPAGTVRSWASRGDLLPVGHRGASPTYPAAQLVDLARTREAANATRTSA